MSAKTNEQIDEYRRQLDQCTPTLSIAQLEHATRLLDGTSTVEQLKMFTDGNLDKRYGKLMDQLDLLEEVVDDLDELIVDYVKSVPLAAYDTGPSDACRFLDRLSEQRRFSDQQRDAISCQRSQHEVEFVAREHRVAHVRFQELLTVNHQSSTSASLDPALWVHLNPAIVMTRFHTTLFLGDESDVPLPVPVALFPVGNDVRTALLEPDGIDVVQRLKNASPERVRTFVCRFGDDEVARDILMDMNDVGLIAFG